MTFTDEQFAQLLTMLKPLHDAAALWISQQTKVDMPNLFRPIEEFEGFDFESQIPGCRVIARDKFGPTEIEYNGRVCRRYRSSEDDSKGIDIRYRCVISGTVADKNMVWGSLIKFGVPKKVKPLNTAVRETIEERKATAATQAQPVADPVVKAAESLGGKVRDVPAPELVRARAELAKLAADAKDAGIDIPSSAIGTDADDVAMCYTRAATLRNLLEAHKRSGPPPAPPETSPGAGAVAYGPEAGERVSMQIQALAARMQGRGTTPAQDGQLVATLNALCGSEDKRREFLRGVFLKESLKDLAPAQKRGLYDWLKPSMKDGKAISVNPDATHAVAAVLIYATTLAQPAGVPA
jgi:hypothetical protein